MERAPDSDKMAMDGHVKISFYANQLLERTLLPTCFVPVGCNGGASAFSGPWETGGRIPA